jgi:hypothetical protein
MNPDRIRLDLLAARYLEAVERDDFETQDQLWKLAGTDPQLVALFRQVHDDLLAEQAEAETARATTLVAAAVEQHLTSAEVVTPTAGPVTVADVANELFRHPPDRLPAAAHALNERLRRSAEELPASLGLTKLVAWAEAKFGPAPVEYWKAFREAALLVRMRAGAETEFQLAARKAPKPEGPK